MVLPLATGVGFLAFYSRATFVLDFDFDFFLEICLDFGYLATESEDEDADGVVVFFSLARLGRLCFFF